MSLASSTAVVFNDPSFNFPERERVVWCTKITKNQANLGRSDCGNVEKCIFKLRLDLVLESLFFKSILVGVPRSGNNETATFSSALSDPNSVMERSDKTSSSPVFPAK